MTNDNATPGYCQTKNYITGSASVEGRWLSPTRSSIQQNAKAGQCGIPVWVKQQRGGKRQCSLLKNTYIRTLTNFTTMENAAQ